MRDCKLAYAAFGDAPDPRDLYIGPEHALNPEEYFIVVDNQIG